MSGKIVRRKPKVISKKAAPASNQPDKRTRRHVEEAPSNSEEHYRSLFDSIDEGFCIIEVIFDKRQRPLDYRFLQVNPAFERLTGIKNAQGRSMREIAPQHEDHWFEIYGRVALTGEPMRFENRADQLHRQYDVYASRFGQPENRQVAIVFNDITERKRAEEALRESEERFRNLADNISQLVWMTDEKGSMFWYNQRWFDYTGATLEETQGSAWQRVVHPQHVSRVAERFSRSIATGEIWEDAFPLLGRDGNYRWFLSRAVPIRDRDEKVLRWFGTNTDIAELRDAQEARRHAEKIAATGQLASSIAHEINNPMQALSNLLALASYKTSNDEITRGLLAMAEQELRRMSRITKQVLSFHSDDSVPVPVKISEVLEDAVEFWTEKIRTRRIDVVRKYECNQDVPAFPGEMRQLFANILGNAIEASPERGSVGIHFYSSVDWRNPARRGVRITITDNGMGIPPAERKRVFEPFFSTKGEKGRGLGLWLVQGIVARHHGSLHFRSCRRIQNRGTCFSIFLPVLSTEALLANVIYVA